MTNVPLLDLKAQFAQIRAEVMPMIDQVCASQHFILGAHVRALEEELARSCSASAGIGRAVPVVVTWTVTPCRDDQRSTTSASAAGSRPGFGRKSRRFFRRA